MRGTAHATVSGIATLDVALTHGAPTAMRTSLVLLLALTTLGSTACGGLFEDEVTGEQRSALGDPRLPLVPCCEKPSEPKTPIPPPAPPPPASLYGTITSYAGFPDYAFIPGMGGHSDGPTQTSFTGPTFMASSPTGLTWVVDVDGDPDQSRIRLIQDTRGVAAGGKHLQTPLRQTDRMLDINAIGGVAVDPATGDLFMSDATSQNVMRLTVAGTVNQVAGYYAYACGWTCLQPSYYVDGSQFDARFNGPAGLARDAQGNVFVADTNNHAIRRIDPKGQVTTVVRDMSASPISPRSLAIDPRDGSFYATSGNAVYHLIPSVPVANPIVTTGQVSLYAGSPTTAGYANYTPNGGKLSPAFALFNTPKGLAVDRSGNVYVADMGNALIRKIVPSAGLAAVETVSFHIYSTQPTFDGYGPDDDAVLKAPFGLSFWNDALVMTDGVRGSVRVLH